MAHYNKIIIIKKYWLYFTKLMKYWFVYKKSDLSYKSYTSYLSKVFNIQRKDDGKRWFTRSCSQQHWRHFTRPTSSHFIHFNATNSDVKSFRCTDFLLPLQSGHGNRRNPPQTLQVVRTLELCNKNNTRNI